MHIGRQSFCLFIGFLGLILAKPAARVETDPELIAGYVEGDMVLENLQRNGLRNPVYKWPNNTVYYSFYAQFDEPHRNHILRGMEILQDISCIRFKEATPEIKTYINITSFPDGCYSQVGWRNKGPQTYNLAISNLDVGCFRLGTIMHELMHTLGFYHMHSSADRDDYVQIVMANVHKDAKGNFKKYSDKTVDHYDEEYDYGSVMHYPAKAFSINGEDTIIPLKKDQTAKNMGQRRVLSKRDINRLNVMYRCPVHH